MHHSFSILSFIILWYSYRYILPLLSLFLKIFFFKTLRIDSILILLVQILHKYSEIGRFCICFDFYTNTTRKLPTRHSALLFTSDIERSVCREGFVGLRVDFFSLIYSFDLVFFGNCCGCLIPALILLLSNELCIVSMLVLNILRKCVPRMLC